MSFPKINPTTTNSWKKLTKLAANRKTLQTYFAEDKDRAKQFSIDWDQFFVDYSKNHLDNDIKEALVSLAKEVGLEDARAVSYTHLTLPTLYSV